MQEYQELAKYERKRNKLHNIINIKTKQFVGQFAYLKYIKNGKIIKTKNSKNIGSYLEAFDHI